MRPAHESEVDKVVGETDPMYRSALARYDEILTAHKAKVETIDQEFAKKAEESGKLREEQAKEAAERQQKASKAVSEARAAFETAKPKAKNTWAEKEDAPDSMLALGSMEDDEDADQKSTARAHAPIERATPPQPIAPSPPPTLHPAPKPTAPSGRHALADDDDDDFGTQSWLR